MKSFGIKRTASFIGAAALICGTFAGFAIMNSGSDRVLADETATVITLTIGSPDMTVDGENKAIDDEGTVPVIVNERTLLPVRAIIETVTITVPADAASLPTAASVGVDGEPAVLNGLEHRTDGTDIVYNTPDEESGALQERIESRNGIHTLEHAESIGFGSRSYRLADIDI